jgi:hypothetical protein
MRFCRFCGTPTSPLSAPEAATQQFSPHTATKEPMAPPTSPVYLPPDRPHVYAGVPMERPRRKRRWPWVLGFVLGFMVLIAGAAGYGVYRLSQTPEGERIFGINRSDEDSGGATGAIARTIPLTAGGKFALAAQVGDVTITTWDKPTVFIDAKRHGGSRGERKSLEMDVDTSMPGSVIIRTVHPPDSRAHLDYEIKLPRQVNIEGLDIGRGDIKIQGVNGNITAHVTDGDIEMDDVVGNMTARTVSGDIRVNVRQPEAIQDMNFESVSGDVDLRFLGDFNAGLDLATVSGDMAVRGDLQVALEEKIGHKQASGHIGKGSHCVVHVKTVSGDIQLRK